MTQPICLVGISSCHQWVIIVVIEQYYDSIDLLPNFLPKLLTSEANKAHRGEGEG